MGQYIITHDKNCPVCEKQFTVTETIPWAYRRDYRKGGRGAPHNVIYFCSWKCLRRFDKEEDLRREITNRVRRKICN